ncbi:MAG: hypothetical protein ACK2UK_07195, partial [Candidatus Promineifilaceae bacterium]
YRVQALNQIGYFDVGAFMTLTVQSVSEPVVYDNSNLPAAPILTASYQNASIVLNWSDTAVEASFRVEGGALPAPVTLPADTTTYSDTAVVDDTMYTYQVFAVVDLTNETPSNVATVTTPPAAPTGLTAEYQAGPMVLNWTDNATYEDGFVIERTQGDSTTLVDMVGAGVTTYSDTSIAFDGVYSYQVYAFNASGNSAASSSNTVSAPPLAPTGLTALYNSGVQLTWFDQSLTETGFSVRRCEGAGCTDFTTEIALVGPLTAGSQVGNVTYLDENVAPLGVYSYRVFAVNLTGSSDPSNTFSITLPDFPAAPSPVDIDQAGSTGNDARRITVTWTAVPDVNGYTIQWATDATFATLVGSGSANKNATSFTTPNNALLQSGEEYHFRIRSNSNANGPSSLWTYYPAYTLPLP